MKSSRSFWIALAPITILTLSAVHADAQIYNWVTGNVIQGTEHITPGPWTDLSYWNQGDRNLQFADFSGGLDLHSSRFSNSWLESAKFTNADLSNTSFSEASLTNADFTGAHVTGTMFGYEGEYSTRFSFSLTTEQLYSTASYKAGDLNHIGLMRADLSDWNFENQNLEGAKLYQSNLENTNLTDAIIKGVDFYGTSDMGFTKEKLYTTMSYKKGDLQGIDMRTNDLTGWDLSNQNLTDASFRSSTLTNTVFNGAIVAGTLFNSTTSKGFTKLQLYSTRSYKEGNLQKTGLSSNHLNGWDLSGQDLTGANLSYSYVTNTLFTNAIVAEADFRTTTSRGFTNQQLYSTLSYMNQDLHGMNLSRNNLTNWNFANQNLTNASFSDSSLLGTSFSEATITGANFSNTTSGGFTDQQFYSTISYQLGHLQGVNLSYNDMEGWNLVNKNLTNASFYRSTMTGLNLSGATVQGANLADTTSRGFTKTMLYSTASYLAGDLRDIDLRYNNLTNWNLANQDLTGADFYRTTLTGVDLTGATVKGVNFTDTTSRGFTKEQLYSTASFQLGDLRKIKMYSGNMDGWNLADQNLSDSTIYSVSMIGTDLSRADIRGVHSLSDDALASAITENMINADGFVEGLNLGENETLRIWDYDDYTTGSGYYYPSIDITVFDEFLMNPGSAITMLFEDDEWGSTITLESGIPVNLDGTLYLGFAPDTNVDALLGSTFTLFNWNGNLPRGTTFAEINWPYWAEWDISDLYQGGTVTLTGVPEPASILLLALGGFALIRRR